MTNPETLTGMSAKQQAFYDDLVAKHGRPIASNLFLFGKSVWCGMLMSSMAQDHHTEIAARIQVTLTQNIGVIFFAAASAIHKPTIAEAKIWVDEMERVVEFLTAEAEGFINTNSPRGHSESTSSKVSPQEGTQS